MNFQESNALANFSSNVARKPILECLQWHSMLDVSCRATVEGFLGFSGKETLTLTISNHQKDMRSVGMCNQISMFKLNNLRVINTS